MSESLKVKLARAYLKSRAGRTLGKASAEKIIRPLQRLVKKPTKKPPVPRPLTKGPVRKPKPTRRGAKLSRAVGKVGVAKRTRRGRFGDAQKKQLVDILKDDRVWFYHNPGCPACVLQVEVISEAISPHKVAKSKYTKSPEESPMHGHKIEVTPTWVFGDKVVKGSQSPEDVLKHGSAMMKRGSSFGYQIGQVKRYGKQFPNGKGFIYTPNWEQQLRNKGWLPVTTAGTLGREFGPGGFDKVFQSKYFYAPRMAYPGGDLSAALSLNRNCANVKTPMTKYFDAGMFTNGKAVNSFGKRKRKVSEDKWIQSVKKEIQQKGTSGKFTAWCKRNKMLTKSGKVSMACINKALKSGSPTLRKRAQFAKNVMKRKSGFGAKGKIMGFIKSKLPVKRAAKMSKKQVALASALAANAAAGGWVGWDTGKRTGKKGAAPVGALLGVTAANAMPFLVAPAVATRIYMNRRGGRSGFGKRRKAATKRPYNTKKTSTGKTFRGKRPSPSQSAKDFPIGTIRTGGNGKQWEVRAAGKSQRWVQVSQSGFGVKGKARKVVGDVAKKFTHSDYVRHVNHMATNIPIFNRKGTPIGLGQIGRGDFIKNYKKFQTAKTEFAGKINPATEKLNQARKKSGEPLMAYSRQMKSSSLYRRAQRIVNDPSSAFKGNRELRRSAQKYITYFERSHGTRGNAITTGTDRYAKDFIRQKATPDPVRKILSGVGLFQRRGVPGKPSKEVEVAIKIMESPSFTDKEKTLAKRFLVNHDETVFMLTPGSRTSMWGKANVAMHYERPYMYQPITAKKGDLNWYGAGGGMTRRKKSSVDKFPRNGWVSGARPIKTTWSV